MCTSTAYLEGATGRELLVEELAAVQVIGDRVLLRSLFGEVRELEARIKAIDFETGQVILVGLA